MKAVVELYNFERNNRIVGNGFLVALYDGACTHGTCGGMRRLKTLQRFGTDESAARLFAEAHNAEFKKEGSLL